MSEQKIEPALTADEWATREHREGEFVVGSVSAGRANHALLFIERSGCACYGTRSLAQAIALANAAMPDDDPRKITRAHVKMLRGLVSPYNRDSLPGYGVPIEALADALESYLPPDA